ncbi:MAG: DUF4386 domain-containing protein, partial [Bacteroidota bacterium]
TVKNLQEKGGLFQWGIAADILTFSIEIALTSMLFQIFKRQNETQTRIATYARFAMIMVMGVNLLVYLSPLLILKNTALLQSFAQNQIHSLVALFFDIHAAGILLWGIFFGIHLLFLGSLVIQSSQHPSLLGWLILVGSGGYILESVNEFCLSGNDNIGIVVNGLLAVVVLGEIGFAIWLIVKGIKNPPAAT